MTAEGTTGGGTYGHVADLGLAVEAHDLELRRQEVSSGFARVTTLVTLRGRGETGVGEDVTYDADTHERELAPRLKFPLAGEHTMASFSATLEGLVPVDSAPYPRWAFEAAALDLALRQAGLSMPAVFDRPFRPLRFVVSMRLGSPPTDSPVRTWLAADPGLEFKLDPQSSWTPELFASLAALDRVRVLDLKGAYEGTPVDQPFDPVLYRRVRDMAVTSRTPLFIEDPALCPESRVALAGAEHLFSWDAPIHSVADVEALPCLPGALNIKPSRFGSLRRLLEAIDYGIARGVPLYGGGQFELGPGRDQIQALASLFYAGSANDVAPSAYNIGAARGGLPRSPLAPPSVPPIGFRFLG